ENCDQDHEREHAERDLRGVRRVMVEGEQQRQVGAARYGLN
ncbi:MAG: hypothetical protein QOD52_1982, partial [Gaiellaceae bacterium]|nr:hypothetical protein [Gaiellaceae bacterium]